MEFWTILYFTRTWVTSTPSTSLKETGCISIWTNIGYAATHLSRWCSSVYLLVERARRTRSCLTSRISRVPNWCARERNLHSSFIARTKRTVFTGTSGSNSTAEETFVLRLTKHSQWWPSTRFGTSRHNLSQDLLLLRHCVSIFISSVWARNFIPKRSGHLAVWRWLYGNAAFLLPCQFRKVRTSGRIAHLTS